MSRFDLTYEQATYAANQYASDYRVQALSLNSITKGIPECTNPAISSSDQCVAYAQWSAAAVTDIQKQESVTQATDTVSGFPEIKFFNNRLVNKTLVEANN